MMKKVIKNLNVNVVILGCTELPLVIKQSDIDDVTVIDSLDALKEALINTEPWDEESMY